MKLTFSKITGLFLSGTLLLAGCQASIGQNPAPISQPSTTEITNNIYPDRDAKIGQTYGQMTLEKISKIASQDEASMYAFFKGSVALAGSYEYFQSDAGFGLDDRVCFTVDDADETKKLPQSKFFYDQNQTSPSRFFCFSNNDQAKKFFGTAPGIGKATITISSLQNIIEAEGEFFDEAVLEQVTTKTAPKERPEAKDINSKSVTWNGKTYKFVHNCQGEVKTGKLFGDDESVNFCLGENMLRLQDSTNKVTALSNVIETNISKAPVLLGAELLPGSADGIVLLSYGAESCTTQDSCGAGMPTNYVTMAVNLKDESFRSIKNYPSSGTPVWNSTLTKAIFITDSCGGAGCDIFPLAGYNLTTDSLNQNLTKESAVGGTEIFVPENSQDVDGNKLAYWKKVSWTSNSQFKATLVNPDGKEKTVTGTF